MKLRLPLAIALLVAGGARASAEGCPEAREQRLAGDPSAAEAAARRCLARDRDDVGTWLELSRALGQAGHYDQALDWVQRGLARYPNDGDLGSWQASLLMWQRAAAEERERETLVRQSSRVELGVTPSFASHDTWDELATRASVNVRAWSDLWLGVASELRARDGGAAHASLYGSFGWRGADFGLDAGIGGGLGDNPIAPELSAWIEPGVRVARPVWVSLRYWRLDWAAAGSNILSPDVVVGLGPVELDLRYWLTLDDAGAAKHAAVLRARWSFASGWVLELGGGLGNTTDNIEPRPGASGWLALAGLRFSPVASQRLGLGYVQRHESSGATSDVGHELTLSWLLTL